MELILWWMLIGLGCWLGLIIPKWKKLFGGKYTAVAIVRGFILTVVLFPIALLNNRDQK